MENTQEIKCQPITTTNSEELIERIMHYVHPTSHTYHTTQGSVIPLIDKFNIQYLTSLLDRNKIQSIDKVYKSKTDGFNLLQFVRFFLNVIQHEQIQTLYLTIALIDFFKEISQTCGYCERLHFIDITNYICSRILQQRDEENQIESKFIPDYRTIIPNFKIKDYLLNPPRIFASKDELVYKLSLNKTKIDKTKHEGVVTNCYFSSTLMKIFTLDDLSDSISVYNTSCTLIKKIKPNFSKIKKDVVVLSFAYSQRQERIGAVLKDFTINFWDNSDNFEFQKSMSTTQHCQECQTSIWFFQYFNAWVTSDKSGCLYIWDLLTEKPERKIKLVFQTQVNDLVVIPCINLVAVAQERKISNESKRLFQRRKKDEKQCSEFPEQCKKQKQNEHESPVIYLYDFFKGEVTTKIQLTLDSRNPHTLQYSQNYQVLLSAGYEKKISIFQINKTFLDTCKKGELTGHESLITSFIVLKKSPMVISADDKGKVKIWDIRNYKCVQTLDFRDKTNITKMLDMLQLGKISVLGSRISFVEFDEKTQIQKKLNTKQKLIPLWVQYDYTAEELIILTKKDLRVIDMHKGVVKNIYCQFHLEDIQITFFKYFETLRKFVIGNEKGEVKIYCVRTGKLYGRLIQHSGSIIHIEYDQQNKIFITMAQDSTIQIQKHSLGISSEKINCSDDQLNNTQANKDKNQNNYRTNHIKTKKNQQLENYEIVHSTKKIATNISRVFDNFGGNKPQVSTSSKEDPNVVLLRQIKNNFNGKQLTLACVSIYHGFLAVGSSEKRIYIWDYQFAKLLMEINLPTTIDSNVQPTSLSFINGYSILALGTSDGCVYFLKISKMDQSYKIKTIGIFRSQKQQPILNIITDLLIKGFLPSKQKFIHCKVYLGHLSGEITCIDLTEQVSTLKQESSVLHKKNFNAERQLRQNFTSEIQKKKYQSYTINIYLDEPIIGEIGNFDAPIFKPSITPKNKTIYKDVIHTFEAHKGNMTGMNIFQLDQSYLVSIGMDERLKIWKQNKLICDWNINLPLPFKWEIYVKNQQKKRDKIMFALKIIQQIFLKYGNDISVNESKCLKVRKLLQKVKEQSQDRLVVQNCNNNFITQPKQSLHTSSSPTLFQNEFTQKDLHYDCVKKFNFNEIAGPTLREIEVQKKLNNIQKQFKISQEKADEQKDKLLFIIRNRAQKNEEKEQILQFLKRKNYHVSQSKEREISSNLNHNSYIKNLISKMDSIMSQKASKKQTFGTEASNTTFGLKSSKENHLSMSTFQKSKVRDTQQRTIKTLQKERKKINNQQSQKQKLQVNRKCRKSEIITFEKYFEEKENNFSTLQNSVNRYSAGMSKTSSNFRNILNKMNDKIKKSKRLGISQKQFQDQQCQQFRFFSIATSDGKRSINKVK